MLLFASLLNWKLFSLKFFKVSPPLSSLCYYNPRKFDQIWAINYTRSCNKTFREGYLKFMLDSKNPKWLYLRRGEVITWRESGLLFLQLQGLTNWLRSADRTLITVFQLKTVPPALVVRIFCIDTVCVCVCVCVSYDSRTKQRLFA